MVTDLADNASGRRHWRFSTVRLLAANSLLAASFAAFAGLVRETFYPLLAVPVIGACWLGAFGMLRDGAAGFWAGAVIGGVVLPGALFLIYLMLLLG